MIWLGSVERELGTGLYGRHIVRETSGKGRAVLIMSGLVDNAVLLFGVIAERLVRTLVLGFA